MLFLTLDERIVIHLADALGFTNVNEQFRVAMVRHPMVDHGRADGAGYRRPADIRSAGWCRDLARASDA